MTDLDAIIENATVDLPTPVEPKLPKRHGLWRVMSMLAVIAAVVISAWSILQSRDASNVSVPDREPVQLRTATVTVNDLPIPGGAHVAVLGLPEAESRQAIDAAGAQIDLPSELTSVIALTSGDGSIVGMAVVAAEDGRPNVRLSPASTAEALLVLAPGILQPNITETFANLDVIRGDPAFVKLVDAIAANPTLSEDNEGVEQAYAEIADRLPAKRPQSDQGCDSVLAADAYPAAGTCVQPKDTGLQISNEQDRWALIYSAPNDFADLCATISPTRTDGAEVFVPTEQCVGSSLIVTPGPVTDGSGQATIDERLRIAAAVNSLYEYAGPFADLAGGSAGFSSASVAHIRQNSSDIVESLAFLIETNDEFAAAMDVARSSTTSLDRHTAAVSAARQIIDASDTTALIPQRAQFDDTYRSILDFYVRAGERMIAPRTDWRWEADAVGTIDFGAAE